MKGKILSIILTLALMIPLALSSAAAAPSYLYITGAENTIDEVLIARIKSLGFDVVVKTDTDYDPVADSAGKAAIYISESVASANIVDRFNSIAVPILTSEAYFYDDMGLTGPTADTDFGSNTENTVCKVVKPDHPLMKGLPAQFTIVKDGLATPPTMCWGIVPASNAIAVDPNNPDRAIIFAFEKGEKSIEGLFPSYVLPEKRIAITLHTSYMGDHISDDMFKLFDNAIIYTAGVDPLAPIPTEAPAADTPVSPKTFDTALVFVALLILSLTGATIISRRHSMNK